MSKFRKTIVKPSVYRVNTKEGKQIRAVSSEFLKEVFENTSAGSTLQWTEAVAFVSFDNDINLQVNANRRTSRLSTLNANITAQFTRTYS